MEVYFAFILQIVFLSFQQIYPRSPPRSIDSKTLLIFEGYSQEVETKRCKVSSRLILTPFVLRNRFQRLLISDSPCDSLQTHNFCNLFLLWLHLSECRVNCIAFRRALCSIDAAYSFHKILSGFI